MITSFFVTALGFAKLLKPWHIIVAAFVAWTGIVGVKAYRKGGEAVIEASKREGIRNEKEASKVHDRAGAPGAADRLRKAACRDCD